MKQKVRLPKTDSIEDLARFWDTHDLTDFQNQLEVVDEPIFVRECNPAIRDTSLIGRAKELEVAGMLIRNGIYSGRWSIQAPTYLRQTATHHSAFRSRSSTPLKELR
jgi:hypothetical protein